MLSDWGTPFAAATGVFEQIDEKDEETRYDEQDHSGSERSAEEQRRSHPADEVHDHTRLVGPHVGGEYGCDVGENEVGDSPRREDSSEVYERLFGVERLLHGGELGEHHDGNLVEERECDSLDEASDDSLSRRRIGVTRRLSVRHSQSSSSSEGDILVSFESTKYTGPSMWTLTSLLSPSTLASTISSSSFTPYISILSSDHVSI